MSEPRGCERCRVGGRRQVITHVQAVQGSWDVERAWLLLQAEPREPRQLSPAEVDHLLAGTMINAAHATHVDAAIPGILATIAWADFAGQWWRAEVLIDGHHRAARCQLEGMPFLASVLTLAEARVCQTRPPANGTAELRWVGDMQEG